MAEGLIFGGGGGTSSDDVTASRAHVLSGTTTVTSDSNDEIVEGTMPNRGAWTSNTSNWENVGIPAGYHNGSGYVSGNGAYNKGVSDADGRANPSSTNYQSGYNKGVSDADGRANPSSTNYQSGYNSGYGQGVSDADGRPNSSSTNYQSGYNSGYSAAQQGNAGPGVVLSGYTFTSSGGVNQTGTMQVASLTSFSAAVVGGRRVALSWTVPTAQTGRPYSGVIIRYGTGGYPTSIWDGGWVYMGGGNNASPGGTSTVHIDMPSLGTTYYFSAWFYVNCSAGFGYNDQTIITTSSYMTGYATTLSPYWSWITNDIYVPSGYTADVYLIGGGGGGSCNDYRVGGSGGGGGYVTTVTGVGSGSLISGISIAGGGSGGGISNTNIRNGNTGGTTSCYINGSYYSASGGNGGSVISNVTYPYADGGNGYTNGGNGARNYISDATSGANGILLNGIYYASSGGGGGAYYEQDSSSEGRTSDHRSAAGGGSGAGSGNSGGYSAKQNLYPGGNASTNGSGGGGAGGSSMNIYGIATYTSYGGSGASGGILAYFY